jgi:tRNA nucleotidyltransferase (CCA-adding enzyme)
LQPDAEMLRLCRLPDLAELPRERLFEQFQRLLLQGRKPSLGLELLRRSGQLRHFPEIEALSGVPQDPFWHPEGDVYTHTLLALNAAARERSGDEREDLLIALAVLCHDLGKPATTESAGGRIRARGHDAAGEAPTRSLLARLTGEARLVEEVTALVLEHLRPSQLHEAGAGDAAIRRLSRRVPLRRLVRVARADHLGRSTPDAAAGRYAAGDWLLARAARLGVDEAPPRPVLTGKHLVELGLPPGPGFKQWLETAYEAQLDGRVATAAEAIELLGLHRRAQPAPGCSSDA